MKKKYDLSKKPPLKTHPAKPEFAIDGDTVIVTADENGANPVAYAVLSPQSKRGQIPGDDSSPAGRAEWIGMDARFKRGGPLCVYVDALLWRGIWYVQYAEVQS
jgi:hypothetical protein